MFSEDCEMAFGEQAALIGLLSGLQPSVALEIGTYKGGSLDLIARFADEVHTFDLVSHIQVPNPKVKYHIGDSRQTVPDVLAELAASGRNADFVLIDGDHARKSVAADVAHILDSPAVRRTVVALHDVANEDVRAGIRDAGLDRGKVAYGNLSFVPPWEARGPFSETWGGLGIIVVDEDGDLWPHGRRLDENVGWPSAVSRSSLWHAARPARLAKRRASYVIRPLLRRLKGPRGHFRSRDRAV